MSRKEELIKKLDDLIKKAEELEYEDYQNKDFIEIHFEALIEEIKIGVLDKYSKKISKISFCPPAITESTTSDDFFKWWEIGKKRLIDLLFTTKNVYESLDIGNGDENNAMDEIDIDNCQIFIAHGHDTNFLKDVRLFLSQNHVETIILEDMASKCKTIIDKFEEHSTVKCAIILLSPEDKFQNGDKIVYRARQNVIWEFGFFAGYLSRAKVIAIKNELNHNNEKVEIELPSNIDGVVWIPYDPNNSDWKIKLSKELKEIGYEIDPGK